MVFLGASLILFAIAGAETVSFPHYALYSSAAAGLTSIIAGLLALAS